MAENRIDFFVFDVESIADGDLISRVRYAGEGLSAPEAIVRYRKELMDKNGSDFIPYTYQMPISVVIAKVDSNFRVDDVVVLDEPKIPPPCYHRAFLARMGKIQPTNSRNIQRPYL